MAEKIVRYIIKDEWGEILTSYNAALKDAFTSAKFTAKSSKNSSVVAEYSDGNFKTIYPK
jgi:hypothetical protein